MRIKICDLHNDVITSQNFKNSKKYLIKNSKYIDTIVLAIWTTKTKYNSYYEISKLNKQYKVIIEKPKILFGIEDISAIDEMYYDNLCELDIFYASLTWNFDNILGGGAYGENRLTEKGKLILKKMENANIVLDTAHLNIKTFWDCIDIFSGKIINSHTCMNDVFLHKRNINFDQIKAIINRGGIIGIALVGDFINFQKEPSIDELIEHIDYFVQNFGDDNLAFGTDFYGTENLPKGISNYQSMNIIVEKLIKIGYNEKAIEKIFWKNFNNFLRSIDGT